MNRKRSTDSSKQIVLWTENVGHEQKNTSLVTLFLGAKTLMKCFIERTKNEGYCFLFIYLFIYLLWLDATAYWKLQQLDFQVLKCHSLIVWVSVRKIKYSSCLSLVEQRRRTLTAGFQIHPNHSTCTRIIHQLLR